jgi:hypothetical protein
MISFQRRLMEGEDIAYILVWLMSISHYVKLRTHSKSGLSNTWASCFPPISIARPSTALVYFPVYWHVNSFLLFNQKTGSLISSTALYEEGLLNIPRNLSVYLNTVS